jgi:hypothetical protein
MAATMERLQEYKTHNAQFCKRMFDFLSIMFTAQVSGFNCHIMKSIVFNGFVVQNVVG